jgi:hypothetical protein
MAKKESKGMTIDQYLNSLSKEERFKVESIGIHASYNVRLGLERLMNEHLIEAERSLTSSVIESLIPLADKGQKFTKNPKQQKDIARKGGKAKFETNYARFVEWVIKNEFDVKDHEKDSNENFAKALSSFKPEGFKAAPKTADKYRKKYLSELK